MGDVLTHLRQARVFATQVSNVPVSVHLCEANGHTFMDVIFHSEGQSIRHVAQVSLQPEGQRVEPGVVATVSRDAPLKDTKLKIENTSGQRIGQIRVSGNTVDLEFDSVQLQRMHGNRAIQIKDRLLADFVRKEASTILEVTKMQPVALRDVSPQAFAAGVYTRAGGWAASIRRIVGGGMRCFGGFSLVAMLIAAIADAKELNDPEAVRRIADALEMGEMCVADLLMRPQMLYKVRVELQQRHTQASFSVLCTMGQGA